jgi:alpha-galactosidase
VNQDPLGECARVIKLDDERFLMVKKMADGSRAVGLGNRGEFETRVTAEWSQLGISGQQRVRDLWRQRELGNFENSFAASVPRHAVVLIRAWAAK